MKKSEQFRMAQVAVVTCTGIKPQDKLEILTTLIEREELELFVESEKAKKSE